MMTLRELAADLGLGKSTVADALRGKAGVAAATRARVIQRARELGYDANPLTSALLRQVRSGASPRVRANAALLLDYQGTVRYPYADRLCRGFHERARACGLVVNEFNTRGFASKNVMKILLSRGIEAIALLPLLRWMGHRSLDWSRFVAVSFGYSMARPRLHLVSHHHVHGIRLAFRMCRKKGFRRIGLALGESSHKRVDGLWVAGFLDIQRQLPPHERVRLLLLPDAEFSPGRVARWIRRERPEVVITHTMGGMPAAYAGQSGPVRPVFLDYHVDNPAYASYAGVNQQYERLGAAMADLLSRQLIQNERGIPDHPSLTLLEGSWIDHPSLRPAS